GRAAANVALYLLAERDTNLSEVAERALVSEVARGANVSGEDFLSRAVGLCANLQDALPVLVGGPAETRGDEDADRAGERLVRQALRIMRWPSLVGVLDGQITIVAAASPEEGLEARLETLVSQLEQEGISYHFGVSRSSNASMLDRAVVEAQTAHQLGPT